MSQADLDLLPADHDRPAGGGPESNRGVKAHLGDSTTPDGHSRRLRPSGSGAGRGNGGRATLFVSPALLGRHKLMVGPADEIAADARARGHLRAADADREEVIDVLKAAFVQGRLAKDEFDLRVGQVLASRTYADLAALTGDLPAELSRVQPPEPARGSNDRRAVRAFAGAIVVLPGVTVGVSFMEAHNGPVILCLLGALLFSCVVGVPAAGLVMVLHSWLEKRSSRQISQGPPPSTGSEAPGHLASADPYRQLPPITHDPRHTSEASPPPPESAKFAGRCLASASHACH